MTQKLIRFVLGGLVVALFAGAVWLPNAIRIEAQTPVYIATLNGAAAIPPNESEALGSFVARPSGDTLEFELLVPRIARATTATLNLAAVDEHGERIAFLVSPPAPSVEGPGERSRQLGGQFDYDAVSSLEVRAQVVATSGCGFQCPPQLVGSLRGDLAGLIQALDAGYVYVVVLTKEYPAGEIRGRVELTDEQDPRVRALAESDVIGSGSPVGGTRSDDDEGFPAWAWAVVIGGLAVVGLGGAQFRPRRRP
ncbi:MAG TPA: CHRD domain-containing protein [Dehalococcoidia bacterium]|nr:CHRD domain-containing protein [Dehalococcoidia bacterium]